METIRTCPQCQQPLSADAPDGLCPQCLMKAASGPPPSATGVGLPADIIDIGDPAEVAKKLPQFEILEMLGRGGMGVVYKARQLQLDRLVALKILPPVDALSPDFVARFTREARALARLNHPNIVNVHDFGETGGLYYIVMEYVEGANLRQLFEARKLTPAEALAIVPKICDALEYAHEEGLVHRDIKPENLLIDKKGRVKIADFGLAKLLRREPLDMTLTLSGMALGTLRYMAPEQMDKPESVDHRADLYSLGVVIYEMLTGETPVGRFELPSQKAQVDVRLDQIVLHALEREPARRYQHASEVRDDVEEVTSKPQAAPSPASVPPAPDDEEDAAAVQPVSAAWGGRIIGLVAVVLAFFNPWGSKAWYFFAAGCAIFGVLSAFGIGRRKTAPSQVPVNERVTNKPGIEPMPSTASPAVEARENQRASDALGILKLLFLVLQTLSWFGILFGSVGMANVLAEMWRHDDAGGATGSLWNDMLIFGTLTAASIFAAVMLSKAKREGRDRLARLVALDVVAICHLYATVSRHWWHVPWSVGVFFGAIALVCYLVLRFGPEMPAAFAALVLRGKPSGKLRRIAPAVMALGLVAAAVVLVLYKPHRNLDPNPYTYTGLPAPFVKGPDGPMLAVPFIKKMDFTPTQVAEMNKTFQSYYREFLSLERRHTEVTHDAQGRIHIAISPFPEESLALAQRMAQELSGLVGKEVIPAPQPGMLMSIGLFRHAGEASVAAELWKEAGYYHFKEERVGAPNSAHVNEGGKVGRSTSSSKLSETIPEEYLVYWKEPAP